MTRARLPIRAIRRLVRALGESAGAQRWSAGLAILLGGLFEGAGYLLLVPILGSATGGVRSGALIPGLGSGTGIVPLLLLFAAAMAARAVVLYWRDIQLWQLSSRFVEAQRSRVMRRLAGADWASIARLEHARITNLLGEEMTRVGVAAQTIAQIASALLLLAVQVAVALVLAPSLTLAILTVLVPAGAVLLLLPSRAGALGTQVNTSSLELMRNAAALLGGLKAAMAQELQHGFVAAFDALQAQARAWQFSFVERQARARLVFGVAAGIAAALVFAGGLLFFDLPAAVLLTLLVILARLGAPAMAFQQSVQQLSYNLPAFDSVRTLEEALAASPAPAAGIEAPPPGPLVLDRVRFLHPGGGGVEAASLSIAPGEIIGISGPSGCGKTTLLDMIVGLLAPQSGKVTVGGAPLDPANAGGWRRQIAYAVQDQFLFHDSIRRNLDRDGSAEEARLWEALAVAGADGLVRGLPQGLDTVVGERGTLLSGGERQRIGLARALLRSPRLLVLDEATGSIDAESEAAILGRLRAMPGRPMVLLVTHRAESLDACDRVIRMELGRLTG